MTKSQVKVLKARIAKFEAAVQISKANAKTTKVAKFRKLAKAKAVRLSERVKAIRARLAA